MKLNKQNKGHYVQNVFDQVFNKYDLMNDIMSLGTHRIWKKEFINWMAPSNNKKLLDMACGSGDITKLFIDSTKNSKVEAMDANSKMISIGKKKLYKYKNIRWSVGRAEKLKFESNIFDFYTISFGLRNVADIDKALKEAFRVLKPGGRFMCLEFSKINNETLDFLYQKYSKVIPYIGKYIVGNSKPYEYLTKSIKDFYTQEELVIFMKKNGFSNIEFRNLSGGISAIHSGWKI